MVAGQQYKGFLWRPDLGRKSIVEYILQCQLRSGHPYQSSLKKSKAFAHSSNFPSQWSLIVFYSPLKIV